MSAASLAKRSPDAGRGGATGLGVGLPPERGKLRHHISSNFVAAAGQTLRGLTSVMAAGESLEHFLPKWSPVRRRECGQDENLEP